MNNSMKNGKWKSKKRSEIKQLKEKKLKENILKNLKDKIYMEHQLSVFSLQEMRHIHYQ